MRGFTADLALFHCEGPVVSVHFEPQISTGMVLTAGTSKYRQLFGCFQEHFSMNLLLFLTSPLNQYNDNRI